MNEAEYVERLRALGLDDDQIEKSRQAALDLAATYSTIEEASTSVLVALNLLPKEPA